jgi:hypothetical protein
VPPQLLNPHVFTNYTRIRILLQGFAFYRSDSATRWVLFIAGAAKSIRQLVLAEKTAEGLVASRFGSWQGGFLPVPMDAERCPGRQAPKPNCIVPVSALL